MKKVKEKKIPLDHHRSNLGISQQAGTEWLDNPYLLNFAHLSQWQRIRIHTENFCSLLSVWLFLSQKKRFLISWEHLTTQSPEGLFLQLLPTGVTEPHWILERKVTKKAQLRVQHHPDAEVMLYFSLHAKLFSPAPQAVRWPWTAAVSLPFPLSFRDRMYLNSIATFSQRITKPLQTFLFPTVERKIRRF